MESNETRGCSNYKEGLLTVLTPSKGREEHGCWRNYKNYILECDKNGVLTLKKNVFSDYQI